MLEVLVSSVCRTLLFLLLVFSNDLYVDSETSYTWRLDMDVGKVMPASHFPQPPPNAAPQHPREQQQPEENMSSPVHLQETVLDILLSTVTTSDGSWKKTSREQVCVSCERPGASAAAASVLRNNRGIAMSAGLTGGGQGSSRRVRNRISSGFTGEDFIFDFADLDDVDDDDVRAEKLDCGKAVNFTYYDHLKGFQYRLTQPKLPQPEVALYFRTKRSSKSHTDVNMAGIEKILKILKLDKPKSVELYNLQANYWRFKGDNTKAIECFRRALAVAPNNAEILLNTAGNLFHLEFLDDATFLTRRSLEVQPPDKNAWPQHFQLGQILKESCHYQEAALHLRHVLELKPDHEPALRALRDMESIPDPTLNIYTVMIIVLLVMGVLFWIVRTTKGVFNNGEDGDGVNGSKAKMLRKMNNMSKNKR